MTDTNCLNIHTVALGSNPHIRQPRLLVPIETGCSICIPVGVSVVSYTLDLGLRAVAVLTGIRLPCDG